MATRVIRLDEVDSTNTYLREHSDAYADQTVVVAAEYQTAGRGQGTNVWESERGKNLLFSVLLRPLTVPVKRQFVLSMAGALAVKQVLDGYIDGVTLKWPNDVYRNDGKISGTLIETTVSSGGLKSCIFGVGLNVNQRQFVGDAPNPVSMVQILGHEVDRERLLEQLLSAFATYEERLRQADFSTISAQYHAALYRREGIFGYRDRCGTFGAAIVRVEDDGRLVLRRTDGGLSSYAFKEVAFLPDRNFNL